MQTPETPPNVRPPDPAHANARDTEKARQRLRRLDPRLDLWFDWTQERWTVMELCAQERWSFCFTWKGPGGEYRSLSDGIEPMLLKLEEIDWQRYGITTLDQANNFLDGRRGEVLQKKKDEYEYLKKHLMEDYWERGEGVRQTFGPGGHRQRKFQQGADSHKLREALQELHSRYQGVVE